MNQFLSYVDPATTAIIWQVLAGVLISLGVVLGIWWTKVSAFFKSVWVKLFGKKKKTDGQGDAQAAKDDENDEAGELEKMDAEESTNTDSQSDNNSAKQ